MSASEVAIIQGDVTMVKAESRNHLQVQGCRIGHHHQSGSSISTSGTIPTIDCKGKQPEKTLKIEQLKKHAVLFYNSD